MRVFLTGATGLVGSALVPELIAAGHTVLGLARSDMAAIKLRAAGAHVHRGDLEDLASLRAGAAAVDGVIHAGFVHDFTRFADVCEIDRRAIAAMGDALEGSERPLIVTSGTAFITPGRPVTEEDAKPAASDIYPRMSEEAADTAGARGMRAMAVRLSPSVHGDADRIGFIPMLIATAREKGVSAYTGDGSNRWSAVHVLDAARLFRLAIERPRANARFHGAADEAIAFREIATVIGRRLGLPIVSLSPDDGPAHFGWLTAFISMDSPVSSKRTREMLGWQPTRPGLIADLETSEHYFAT